MTQSVLVQLSSAGTHSGPFDLSDSFASTIATGVPKSLLLAPAPGVVYGVNALSTYVRVQSAGLCTNYVNLPIPTTTTTTTTTTVPPVEYDILYVTNRNTASNRGIRVWFSQNNYYSTPPFSTNPANFLGVGNLGSSPNIFVTIDFWYGTTIDDGFGNYLPPDGTKTININSDALVYDGGTGAWKRNNGIFTLTEGLNIGAIRITNSTVSYFYSGINHYFILPPINSYIRVNPSFNGGSTPAFFIDII